MRPSLLRTYSSADYTVSHDKCALGCTTIASSNILNLNQWFPTFFDAFLPLLILELCIPPLWTALSSLVLVSRLVLTTIGTTLFIDDKNLINKSGTKTICCQIMALKFVNKNV